jgi:glycosyltransferase involved in cell wall biosynthesis
MSALEQDLDPESHEILVFNNSNGPLPETDWLSSPRIKIIDSHSNLIHASNLGARMAAGKFINFLHDDDYLLPGALKALVEAGEISGNYWICGAYNLIDDEGNFVSLIEPQIKGNILALLVGGECLHLAASVINRASFLRVGGFDVRISGPSDLDLECQLALLSDFKSIDQVVAAVRLSGGRGSSYNWTDHTKNDFRSIREKVLNSNNAFSRMRNSVKDDVLLRGRASRAYLFSAVLNLLGGHFVVTGRRLFSLFSLIGYFFILPKFWQGLFFRSHWHNIQKMEQEEYFRLHQAS